MNLDITTLADLRQHFGQSQERAVGKQTGLHVPLETRENMERRYTQDL